MLGEYTNENYTRDQAKKLMFRIAFAKPRDHNIEKEVFKEMFPGIIEFINEYKGIFKQAYLDNGVDKTVANEKGNSSFSVTLQRIESKIFIDTILQSLIEDNYKCLSKHDSILCKESDKVEVEIKMKIMLDEIFGENSYQLKEE